MKSGGGVTMSLTTDLIEGTLYSEKVLIFISLKSNHEEIIQTQLGKRKMHFLRSRKNEQKESETFFH